MNLEQRLQGIPSTYQTLQELAVQVKVDYTQESTFSSPTLSLIYDSLHHYPLQKRTLIQLLFHCLDPYAQMLDNFLLNNLKFNFELKRNIPGFIQNCTYEFSGIGQAFQIAARIGEDFRRVRFS